ncbi:hypothetical protein KCV06_g6943, partial [Aureobasidium melanogenum]
MGIRDSFLRTVVDTPPLSYTTPPFPSLYWPFPVGGTQTLYLYHSHDMWRFTLLWTIIDVVGIHLIAAAFAMAIQWRNWKLIWLVPIVFGFIGAVEAIIAGNVVGGLLSGVYSAGYFRMSTWIPFSWGAINSLVLILSSFAIQGGMRVTAIALSAIISWRAASHTQYNLLSNIDDTDEFGRFAIYTTSHFLGRLRIRHLIWIVLVAMPSLVVLFITLVAVIYPSYSHPPHHYNVLRSNALRSTEPGRINIEGEKVFIASSIYDKQGELTSGPWAQNLLDLVDLLGPENVFLSVFEDDPDDLARASLEQFSKQLKFAGHVDRAALPHVELPTGEKRLKRIEFLAHVRNRALAPLEDPKSAAYSVHFDKLLYVNDVVFDPIDAANLIFSTNIDENGKAKYHAACAADFINPFKYYDTFATRDDQGNRIGVPIYPWFSGADDSNSRRDVLDQKDAVRVRSCWGGMTVFNTAGWFQTDDIHADSGVADLTLDHNITSSRKKSRDIYDHTTTTSLLRKLTPNTTTPIRFRANPDTYWDASECCLIHADLEAAVQRSGSSSADIYLNPYIRVAYSSRMFAYLHISRRFERLFAPLQKSLNARLGLPAMNSRRTQEVGEQYEEMVWGFDDAAWNVSGNMSGSYRNVTRVALPGGFCGVKQLLVLGEGNEIREWFNEAVEIPTLER